MEDLKTLFQETLDEGSQEEEDIVQPEYMVLLGCWWFTRGIEASAAKRRDVRINEDKNEVAWNLPASKRDPKALGEERTHGCLCDEQTGSQLCPFHAMKTWLEQLQRLFPEDMEHGSGPLFPTYGGQHASNEATVKGIRQVMQRLREPLTRKDGTGKETQRFGEHVMRVAGAQFFARRGVELFLIQLYARWGSTAILKYVQEAPLGSQARVAQRVAKTGELLSLEEVQEDICRKKSNKTLGTREACSAVISGDVGMSVYPWELETLVERITMLEQKVPPTMRYAANCDTFCVHRVAIYGCEVSAKEWRTVCKWKFAKGNYKLLEQAPEEAKCDTCWGTHIEKMHKSKRRKKEVGAEVPVMNHDNIQEEAKSNSEPEKGWDD